MGHSFLFKESAKRPNHTQMGDAILIEIRSHRSSVVNALQGAVRALPHTWTVQYWHGDDNDYDVPSIVKRHLNATFPVQYKLGQQSQRKRGWWASRKWFNDILTSKLFWNTLKKSHLLLFQTDTAFCAQPDAIFSDFLKYTYVGAPWHPTSSKCGDQNLCWQLWTGSVQSARCKVSHTSLS